VKEEARIQKTAGRIRKQDNGTLKIMLLDANAG
jgi:hypothetical protein